ncbi:gaf domain protein, partial [Cystoisospora suis]
MLPFIGFGFVDNFVMILAGDMFDTSLCVILGLSTMSAAALGNWISDLMGLWLGSSIENFASKLRTIPKP